MARPRKVKPELDLNIYTKSGKLRRRKRKQSRNYFTQDTQDAIVQFNAESTYELKSRIFNDKINFSFRKLSENLINTFKFYYTEVDNVEQLITEVVSFLFQKIHLYDPEQGKAYSYFGTIAKHWLTTYNRDNYKNLKDRADLTEVDENKSVFIGLTHQEAESDLIYFVDKFILYVEKNMETMFERPMDRIICEAVLEIFRKRESIEVLNKQSFYLYVKEITGNTAPQITTVVKQLKLLYIKLMDEYYLEGDIYI